MDKPECKWAHDSPACKLGFIDACSDITSQKIGEIFDVMRDSLAF